MTSFTYFSSVSDVNVNLSEGLFLHVAAQIYILLMYRFHGAIVQANHIRYVYCNPTEPLYPTLWLQTFINTLQKKREKYKTKLKIGHQKYRIDKPVISTLFFFFFFLYKS